MKPVNGLIFSLAALTAAGGAVAQSRPNVILIISDEHQVNALGCYGSINRTKNGDSPTPNIDKLAQEGVMFTNAYTPSPLSAPARAAMITGVYPYKNTAIHHLENGEGPGITRYPGILDQYTTIGNLFRKGGYTTAAIGKMHVHGELKGVNDLGFDRSDLRFYTTFPGAHYSDRAGGDWNARYREFHKYNNMKYRDIDPVKYADADPELTVKGNGTNKNFMETLLEKEEQGFDYLVTQGSSSFIDDCIKEGKQFFLHVGYEKPHAPYSTFKKYMDLWDTEKMMLPPTWDDIQRRGRLPFVMNWMTQGNRTAESARKTMAAYYACISELDDEVGKLIKKCKEAGIYDNTIFIYTTDHGDNMFTHSMVEKHCMFEMASRIPLIISYPPVFKKGEKCDRLVSLIDIAPTILELTDQPIPSFYEGESLTKAIDGTASPDRMIFSEFHTSGDYMMFPKDKLSVKSLPMRMCRWKSYKYVYTHGHMEQLYDLAADPDELNNLVFTDPVGNKDIIERLRLATLQEWAIDDVPLMNVAVDKKSSGFEFSFTPIPEAKEYILYRGDTSDPLKAQEVARSKEGKLVDSTPSKGKSYYWITTEMKLTRKMPRGGILYKDVEVATENFPFNMPSSRMMDISPSVKKARFDYIKQRTYNL